MLVEFPAIALVSIASRLGLGLWLGLIGLGSGGMLWPCIDTGEQLPLIVLVVALSLLSP